MDSKQSEKKPEAIGEFQEQEREPQDLETTEAKPDFARQLADIRAASNLRKEQINSLLELETARSNLREEAPEPLSFEEVQSRFEELLQNSESLSASEYLNKIQKIRNSVSRLAFVTGRGK